MTLCNDCAGRDDSRDDAPIGLDPGESCERCGFTAIKPPEEQIEDYDARRANAYCDWCGKTIEDTGEQFSFDVLEDANVPDKTPQDVAYEIAWALENAADDSGQNAVLADIIREYHSYQLHGDCYEQTALPQVFDA